MNILSNSKFPVSGLGKKAYLGFTLLILVAIVSVILICLYRVSPPLFHLSTLVVMPGLVITLGGAIATKIYEPNTVVDLVGPIVETAIVNLMIVATTWGFVFFIAAISFPQHNEFTSYFSSLTRNASLIFWALNSFCAFVTIGRRQSELLLAMRGLPFVVFIFLILLWLRSLGM